MAIELFKKLKQSRWLRFMRPAWRTFRRWLARRSAPCPQPGFTPSNVPLAHEPIDFYLQRKLESFLSSPNARITFPIENNPIVSIVILSFNKAALLLECLESVAGHTLPPYELILADNASTDRSAEVLSRVDGALIIRNKANLDFIVGNNEAVKNAQGKYLLFLNHDTVVTPGWLNEMLATMESWPSCGAVGARLIRMDGRLQEAGSLLRPDGTAFGYGRDDPDPFKPEYGHARETDYCSGACLLVDRETFLSTGGFDTRYLPAYYEETDYCLRLRAMGKKVVYQGQAIVLHREDGVLSGRAQALCQANHPKFVDKFRNELQLLKTGDTLSIRDRRPGKRVLVMDDYLPDPSRGAGMPRTRLLLLDLAKLGCVVTYVPLHDSTPQGDSHRELQRLGIEVFHGNFSLPNFLEERKGHYSIAIVCKPHNAENMLWRLRKSLPDATLVYDTEAIIHQREEARAQLEGKPLDSQAIEAMAEWEFSLMRQSDKVLTVCANDRDQALGGSGNQRVGIYGYPMLPRDCAPGFSQRQGLVFAGGLTAAHAPNVDGLSMFLRESWPIIREALPGCGIKIVGANPCPEILAAALDGVEFLGRVEELSTVFDKARVAICPLRYGAGVPIKLAESLALGVPTVASPVAAQGYGLLDGSVAAVAHSWDSFAHEVIHLMTNQHAWNLRQEASLQFTREHLNPDKQLNELGKFLEIEQPITLMQSEKAESAKPVSTPYSNRIAG